MKELNSKITYIFTMFFVLSGLIVSLVYYNQSMNETNALSKVVGKVTSVTYEASSIRPTKINKHTRFIAQIDQNIKFSYVYDGKDYTGEFLGEKAVSKTRHQKEQAEEDLSNMQLKNLYHEGDNIILYTDGETVTNTLVADNNIDNLIGVLLFGTLFLGGIIYALYKKHNEHIPIPKEYNNFHKMA